MDAEHVDVLIIGAGLSGVGAGYHLAKAFPDKRYLILEAREAIGGTWDLFRYPGVRSDSDMHTFGYRFRPWTEPKSITDGPSILNYIRQTAADAGVDRHVRFGHRVTRTSWSTPHARWTVDVTRLSDGAQLQFTCRFLYACCGYYRYDHGYLPQFPGIERYRGDVVHPQWWPQDLDYAGKRIVVIGSGATAVTLVPALAERAAHVVMLQRSPTYILALPAEDAIANRLRRMLGDRRAYPITRWKNVLISTAVYELSQRRPDVMRGLLRKAAAKRLPDGYEVDTHFKPRYNPWDQRLCLVPDGDLFRTISSGRASVVTDTIDTFTETGVRLASGTELDADIVITATGLQLQIFGGATLVVDGAEVSLPETFAYKGLMLSGVPNFAFTIGYINASWTLKADLVSEYVCRLLAYMDAHGYEQCVPTSDGSAITPQPLLNFSAGYVLRTMDQFPKAGPRRPWRMSTNYPRDVLALRYGRINDGSMRFSRAAAAEREPLDDPVA